MLTDRVITMQNEKEAVMIEAEEIAQEAEENQEEITQKILVIQ